jgi:hypothetical protein
MHAKVQSKLEGKGLLERLKHIWMGGSNIGLKGAVCEGTDSVRQVQDRDQ